MSGTAYRRRCPICEEEFHAMTDAKWEVFGFEHLTAKHGLSAKEAKKMLLFNKE